MTDQDQNGATAARELVEADRRYLRENAPSNTLELASRALAPAAQDLVGLVGGDWLREQRLRRLAPMIERTREILNDRGVTSPAEVSPKVGIPLLDAAADTTEAELREIWALLLAAAADPRRRNRVRQSMVDAIKSLEPLDAALFEAAARDEKASSWPEFLKCTGDQFHLSFTNLFELGLIGERIIGSLKSQVIQLAPLGTELARTLGYREL